MSHAISKLEASQFVRFLELTSGLISGEPVITHSNWLHGLASAYGYQSWNAMRPALAECPPVDTEQFRFWGGAITRFGFAKVVIPGQKDRYFARHTYGGFSVELVDQLATSISRSIDLKGLTFRYTRPDPPQEAKVDRDPFKVRLECSTPMVITAEQRPVRIHLWWAMLTYGKGFSTKDRNRMVGQSVSFMTTYSGQSLTDRMLTAVTGVKHGPRCCYYIPLSPFPSYDNKMERYIPHIVMEASADAELADWDFGLDRMAAVREVHAMNARAGLSNLDIKDITHVHRAAEHHPNDEDVFESYGMSED